MFALTTICLFFVLSFSFWSQPTTSPIGMLNALSVANHYFKWNACYLINHVLENFGIAITEIRALFK